MAMLDVSEVLSDPLFTSSVTLIHAEESLNDMGNAEWVDKDRVSTSAVVTSDLKSLERLPDALHREGTILVRVLAKELPRGFQGSGYDSVIWRGQRFVVKDASDYSQFSMGFMRLVCWPMEVTDGGY